MQGKTRAELQSLTAAVVERQAGGLIPGWVEALKIMKTGDTWEIVVPADLGYGSEGAGDTIPADQTLIFTMALTKVEYAP